MVLTKDLLPAKKFGLGYFIQEQMELRKLSRKDLAYHLGLSDSELEEILKDKHPISKELAQLLSLLFKSSPQYWLNLDGNYRKNILL